MQNVTSHYQKREKRYFFVFSRVIRLRYAARLTSMKLFSICLKLPKLAEIKSYMFIKAKLQMVMEIMFDVESKYWNIAIFRNPFISIL